MTRIGRSAGYKCLASDVIYDSTSRQKSALNLCGNEGFALLNSSHAWYSEAGVGDV